MYLSEFSVFGHAHVALGSHLEVPDSQDNRFFLNSGRWLKLARATPPPDLPSPLRITMASASSANVRCSAFALSQFDDLRSVVAESVIVPFT